MHVMLNLPFPSCRCKADFTPCLDRSLSFASNKKKLTHSRGGKKLCKEEGKEKKLCTCDVAHCRVDLLELKGFKIGSTLKTIKRGVT